jgi:hypothetical protein
VEEGGDDEGVWADGEDVSTEESGDGRGGGSSSEILTRNWFVVSTTDFKPERNDENPRFVTDTPPWTYLFSIAFPVSSFVLSLSDFPTSAAFPGIPDSWYF